TYRQKERRRQKPFPHSKTPERGCPPPDPTTSTLRWQSRQRPARTASCQAIRSEKLAIDKKEGVGVRIPQRSLYNLRLLQEGGRQRLKLPCCRESSGKGDA